MEPENIRIDAIVELAKSLIEEVADEADSAEMVSKIKSI